MVSISFGIALVAGRTRVPRPATGKTALRIFMGLSGASLGKCVDHVQSHVGSRFASGNKGGCVMGQTLPRFRRGNIAYNKFLPLLSFWKRGEGVLKAVII